MSTKTAVIKLTMREKAMLKLIDQQSHEITDLQQQLDDLKWKRVERQLK